MTENFPKLMSDTKPQIQEVQRTPNRINAPKTKPRDIIFILQKINTKLKILKEARGKKHLAYREAKIRIISSFSSETMQARRKWSKLFKVLRDKTLQLEISTLQNYHSKVKEKLRFFSDK